MQENRGVFRWDMMKEELETDFIKNKEADKIPEENPAFMYTFSNNQIFVMDKQRKSTTFSIFETSSVATCKTLKCTRSFSTNFHNV